jgi:hypothetical protein
LWQNARKQGQFLPVFLFVFGIFFDYENQYLASLVGDFLGGFEYLGGFWLRFGPV